MNHTGDKARTQMRRVLVDQTGLKMKTIRKAVTSKRAFNGGAYEIKSRGGDIRLMFFGARETQKGVAFAILIAFLTGSIVFMAFDTTPPYEYDESASFVVPSPANDGDQVTVKWRLKKVNRECPGIAQRVLFDPKTKIILANYDPTPAATSESVRDGYLNRTFALPRALPSGQIAYRADVCYSCNLLQQFGRPLCVPTPNLILLFGSDA